MITYRDWAETHEVHSGKEAWKAAIASLEVTPELVDHAFDSFPSYCQVCPDDIELILASVFAKLKESV